MGCSIAISFLEFNKYFYYICCYQCRRSWGGGQLPPTLEPWGHCLTPNFRWIIYILFLSLLQLLSRCAMKTSASNCKSYHFTALSWLIISDKLDNFDLIRISSVILLPALSYQVKQLHFGGKNYVVTCPQGDQEALSLLCSTSRRQSWTVMTSRQAHPGR